MKNKTKSLRLLLAVCMIVQMMVPFTVWGATPTGTITYKLSALQANSAKFSVFTLAEGESPTYTVTSDYLSIIANTLKVGQTEAEITSKLNELADESVSNSERQTLAYDLTTALASSQTQADAGLNPTNTSGTLTWSVPYGYYLIVDNSKDNGFDLGFPPVLHVVDGTDKPITPKADLPTFTKEIYHNEVGTTAGVGTTDTEIFAATDGWGTVGDNQMGDDVYFRVTTTLPDTVETFTNYYQVLNDVMDPTEFSYDGNYILTITPKTGSAKSYTQDTFSSNSLVTMSPDNDGWNLKFHLTPSSTTFDSVDLLGATVKIEYKAVLLETATVGTGPNINTVELTYSKSGVPAAEEWDGTDTDATTDNTESAEKEVYDWTFSFVVDKIDNKGNAVSGATFVLKQGGSVVNLKKDGDTYYVDPSTDPSDTITTTGNPFTIKGLDDALEYTLEETAAPATHAIQETEVKFTITADYDTGSSLTEFFAEVSTTKHASAVQVDKNSETDTGEDDGNGGTIKEAGLAVGDYTHVSVPSNGQLNAAIVNLPKDVTLPETGGMGTVMFYVAGIGMMAAGVFLVLKRKNS